MVKEKTKDTDTNIEEKSSRFADNRIKREEDIIRIFAGGTDHKFRILFALYKGSYWQMLGAMALYLLKASPEWIIPLITANIIDIAVAGAADGANRLLVNLLIVVGVILLNIPLNQGYVYLSGLAKRRVQVSLRGAMVRKLQRLTIGFHKEMRSGQIQSKVMGDVDSVEMLSRQLLFLFLETFVRVVAPLTIIITRNITVLLVFLVTVPIACLCMFPFRRKMRALYRGLRKDSEATASDVLDMEDILPITRAHHLEETELNKVSRSIRRLAERGFRVDRLDGIFGALNWAVFMFFQTVCLCISGYMALNGQISIGDISLYQSYFNSLVRQVSMILSMIPVIAKGTEAISSMGEILNSEEEEHYEDKAELGDLQGDFRLDNIHFHYDDDETPVLKGIDLHVQPGETLALVGESGGGKSTLVGMLLGYHHPTEGALYIDGHNMADLDMRSVRRQLAVVPQNTVLFSGTVRENIVYGCEDVTEEQLQAALDIANLSETIEKLPKGLETSIGEHGEKLSGGQRQRIAIARAVIRDPKVIIFDEATSSLDTVSEAAIQTAIDGMTRDRTTFIVAHRLSTIRQADRIAVIEDGACVECGTYDELMTKEGAFFELRKKQT